MKKRIALYTFGQFLKPSEHPTNDGFHTRNDPMFALVDKAPGFIARSGYEDEPGPELWGEQVYPRFYKDNGDGWAPSTLSLWVDLESPMAYSYFGGHTEALSKGREWFQNPQWPPLVTWWVEGDHIPNWQEGIERLEYLHDNGPTLQAFNFKFPYNEAGQPISIDRKKIKGIDKF